MLIHIAQYDDFNPAPARDAKVILNTRNRPALVSLVLATQVVRQLGSLNFIVYLATINNFSGPVAKAPLPRQVIPIVHTAQDDPLLALEHSHRNHPGE